MRKSRRAEFESIDRFEEEAAPVPVPVVELPVALAAAPALPFADELLRPRPRPDIRRSAEVVRESVGKKSISSWFWNARNRRKLFVAAFDEEPTEELLNATAFEKEAAAAAELLVLLDNELDTVEVSRRLERAQPNRS